MLSNGFISIELVKNFSVNALISRIYSVAGDKAVKKLSSRFICFNSIVVHTNT